MNRGSHRYLLVRFLAKDAIPQRTAEDTVHCSIKEMFGRFGSAEINARMISFDETTAQGVFRCRAEFTERLRAALVLITHVNGSPLAVTVKRVSGTIKGLKVRIQRRR